jgi:hypothetical protein
MKPEVDQILMITAGQVLGELAPNLPTQYSQGVAQLAALMAILSAQEYDRAAEIRAAENRDLRALFAELAPQIADTALRAKLTDAAKDEDGSLRISALDQANYALRTLLIEAQEAVEATADAAARGAETKIWALLKRMADRRQLYLPAS